jgi:hypothetical protein
MQQQGMITLQAPAAAVPSDVYLASGRHVRPDERGCITVSAGDATPLMSYGWTIVQQTLGPQHV